MAVEVRALAREDLALLESIPDGVFDDAIHLESAQSFLDDDHHHLVAAIEDGRIVGFATGVHYLHPDKPSPELWINEVGVVSSHQRRGLAKAILAGLLQHAAKLGCSEAWVLTERGNTPAMRLYTSAKHSEPPQDAVMFNFSLVSTRDEETP